MEDCRVSSTSSGITRNTQGAHTQQRCVHSLERVAGINVYPSQVAQSIPCSYQDILSYVATSTCARLTIALHTRPYNLTRATLRREIATRYISALLFDPWGVISAPPPRRKYSVSGPAGDTLPGSPCDTPLDEHRMTNLPKGDEKQKHELGELYYSHGTLLRPYYCAAVSRVECASQKQQGLLCFGRNPHKLYLMRFQGKLRIGPRKGRCSKDAVQSARAYRRTTAMPATSAV